MDVLTLMDNKNNNKINNNDINCNILQNTPRPAPRVPPINLDDLPKFLLGKNAFAVSLKLVLCEYWWPAEIIDRRQINVIITLYTDSQSTTIID